MKTVTNYARIINFLNTAKSNDLEEGCVEIMSFIVCRHEVGQATKVTDLVQSLAHVTGPTVTRKISLLKEAGFVTLVKSPIDSRVKHLELTPKGIAYLADQYAKLQLVTKQR